MNENEVHSGGLRDASIRPLSQPGYGFLFCGHGVFPLTFQGKILVKEGTQQIYLFSQLLDLLQ